MARIALIATIAILIAGCGGDSIDEARRWDSYYQDLEFRSRYQAVIDATRLAWMVSPFLLLAGLLWIGMDLYRRRAEPLVHLSPDAPVVERRQLREQFERIQNLQRDLAELRAQVAIVAAAHQPAAHNVTWAPRVVVSSDADPVSATGAGLPDAPALRDLVRDGFRPTRHRVILGYSSVGPVYAPLTGLLSTAVAGRPGQGKSTLLRLVTYQTLCAGGKIYLIDPHGSITDDVRGVPVVNAAEPSAMHAVARELERELEVRMHRYRAGRREYEPLLVLVDEMPAVALSSRPAMDVVGRIVLEGRKIGMFAFIAGQGLPAAQLGGRLVRDALSSRYVFRTSPDEARRAGLSNEDARTVARLRPGCAVVDAGVLPEPSVLAIPNCTADDLRELVGSGGSGGTEAVDAAMSNSPLPAASDAEETRRKRVRDLVAARVSQNEIIRDVWGVTGGRAYQQALEEYRAILATLVRNE